jgi:hypothetical protein
LTERHADARRVLRWAKANHKTEVSLEAVRRDALAQKLNAERTLVVIEALVRAGWLRPKHTAVGKAGGRPAYRWEVNPLLWAPAETAGTAETSAEAPDADIPNQVSAVSAGPEDIVPGANSTEDPNEPMRWVVQ